MMFERLTSGLTVEIREMRGAPTSVAVVYRAGMRCDPVGMPGLAHLAEHAFLQSVPEDHTRRRLPRDALTRWTAHTLTDTVEFSVQCPATVVGDAVEILAPLGAGNRITASVVERQRSVVMEELRMLTARGNGGGVWRFLPAALFDDWSLGHDGYGTAGTIPSYDHHAVKQFLEATYVPQRCAVSIVTGETATVQRALDDSGILARLGDCVVEPRRDSEPGLRHLDRTDLALSDPLSDRAEEPLGHALGWARSGSMSSKELGLHIALCSALHQIAVANRDLAASHGYRSVRTQAGFFHPLRATPPWVCTITAQSRAGEAGDPEGLWGELRSRIRSADQNIYNRATALARTEAHLNLADASQRALLHARHAVLAREPFNDEAFLVMLSPESFAECWKLASQMPSFPDGLRALTRVG